MGNNSDQRLVYSTDHGRICDKCQKPSKDCICKQKKLAEVKGKGAVRVRRETKGRGGKTVTTISDLAVNKMQLLSMLADLKKTCGAGGTLKDGVIEIQGDHCDKALEYLAEKGFSAKRAGG